MSRRQRSLLALLLAASISAAAPSLAQAQEDTTSVVDVTTSTQGGTTAVAVNTKDGQDVFRLSFQVRRFTGDVLDIGNAAVAVSSCEDCRTIAVSIQVVLVFSEPSTVTPTNLALALNLDCFSCETMAQAYQLLLGTGGPVKLTDEANLELAQIRKEIFELMRSDLPLEEIGLQIEGLIDRIEEVVRTGIVAVDPGDEGEGDVDEPGGTPTSPSPADTPTVDETSSPAESPSTIEESPTTIEESPVESPSKTPTPDVTADV